MTDSEPRAQFAGLDYAGKYVADTLAQAARDTDVEVRSVLVLWLIRATYGARTLTEIASILGVGKSTAGRMSADYALVLQVLDMDPDDDPAGLVPRQFGASSRPTGGTDRPTGGTMPSHGRDASHGRDDAVPPAGRCRPTGGTDRPTGGTMPSHGRDGPNETETPIYGGPRGIVPRAGRSVPRADHTVPPAGILSSFLPELELEEGKSDRPTGGTVIPLAGVSDRGREIYRIARYEVAKQKIPDAYAAGAIAHAVGQYEGRTSGMGPVVSPVKWVRKLVREYARIQEAGDADDPAAVVRIEATVEDLAAGMNGRKPAEAEPARKTAPCVGPDCSHKVTTSATVPDADVRCMNCLVAFHREKAAAGGGA